MLVSENKGLFNKLSEMEKLLNFQKEKEIKLMKVLFFLNKQGIPIDDIIENQLISEKSEINENSEINRENNFSPLESSKSMDSLMYLPLTLTKPSSYTKPEVIPLLNLRDINNKYNLEYGSAKKSNKNNVCVTDPSYFNQSNNYENKCNNYLIEENDDYDYDVEMGLQYDKNKKVSGNNIKQNNYMRNINNTIHNDFDNRDLLLMVNKNAIKKDLKSKNGISKKLQFSIIHNNISPIYNKNEQEKKFENVNL